MKAKDPASKNNKQKIKSQKSAVGHIQRPPHSVGFSALPSLLPPRELLRQSQGLMPLLIRASGTSPQECGAGEHLVLSMSTARSGFLAPSSY